MSRHIVLKMLAVLLCAFSLAAAVLGAGCALMLQSQGLYIQSMEDNIAERQESFAYDAGVYLVKRYYMQTLAQMPREVLDDPWLYENMYQIEELLRSGKLCYRLTAADGSVVRDTIPSGMDEKLETFSRHQLRLALEYPVLTPYQESDDAQPQPPAQPPEQERNYRYSDVWELYSGKSYQVDVYQGPPVEVTLYLESSVWRLNAPHYWSTCEALYPHRYHLLEALAACGLFAGLMLVYLGIVAGRRRGEREASLWGLNKLPLDLYALVCGAGVLLLFPLVVKLVGQVLYRSAEDSIVLGLLLAGGLSFAVVLPCIGFYCALLAQIKCRCCWENTLLGRIFHWVSGWGRRIYATLPLIWRWLLIGGGLLFMILLAVVVLINTPAGLLLLPPVLLLAVGAILYSGYAMGVLYQGARRMGSGDLSRKIDTRYLRGSFLDFGNQLNALADVTVEAAREQLKSERMKTELITNVSHDIKTPLTSIINYVDLLQHASTGEEREQYLEVLSRQSQRLKKLIEDLMEMSKASSGNLSVELVEMDAAEAVNQALGEYADKLAALPLTVIVRGPEQPAMIQADGRLLWRTLSNLLQNICKYALPGTRLYVDILQDEQDVMICLKNISREELNVSAEELMERFVRGDRARNTEGSGLGLNIARSLMELQGGRLELMIEGDLFRATLFFPAREARKAGS